MLRSELVLWLFERKYIHKMHHLSYALRSSEIAGLQGFELDDKNSWQKCNFVKHMAFNFKLNLNFAMKIWNSLMF